MVDGLPHDEAARLLITLPLSPSSAQRTRLDSFVAMDAWSAFENLLLVHLASDFLRVFRCGGDAVDEASLG
jgi:hypothetical protein